MCLQHAIEVLYAILSSQTAIRHHCARFYAAGCDGGQEDRHAAPVLRECGSVKLSKTVEPMIPSTALLRLAGARAVRVNVALGLRVYRHSVCRLQDCSAASCRVERHAATQWFPRVRRPKSNRSTDERETLQSCKGEL